MRGKVAKYAVPKRIEVVDEMPLTEVYKVDKKLLRESRRAASHEGGS
jgi:non-ribosomal peptide synthetase component E (peptide arylation enzyme)